MVSCQTLVLFWITHPTKHVIFYQRLFYFFRLHEKHPWYSEQLAFLLMNTDNNAYLTKEELMEASKVSDDISALNFSNKQLENLIGMMIVNWLHEIFVGISFE